MPPKFNFVGSPRHSSRNTSHTSDIRRPPNDWVVRTSTTIDPGRQYYLNLITGEARWTFPEDDYIEVSQPPRPPRPPYPPIMREISLSLLEPSLQPSLQTSLQTSLLPQVLVPPQRECIVDLSTGLCVKPEKRPPVDMDAVLSALRSQEGLDQNLRREPGEVRLVAAGKPRAFAVPLRDYEERLAGGVRVVEAPNEISRREAHLVGDDRLRLPNRNNERRVVAEPNFERNHMNDMNQRNHMNDMNQRRTMRELFTFWVNKRYTPTIFGSNNPELINGWYWEQISELMKKKGVRSYYDVKSFYENTPELHSRNVEDITYFLNQVGVSQSRQNRSQPVERERPLYLPETHRPDMMDVDSDSESDTSMMDADDSGDDIYS